MSTRSKHTPSFLITAGLAAFVATAGMAQPLHETRDAFDSPTLEGPTPDEIARDRAEEAGVGYEVTPEGVVLTTDSEDVYILRMSIDGEKLVLEKLVPGVPKTYEIGLPMMVFQHPMSVLADCRPGACSTPKPIPLAGLTERQPPRGEGPVNKCLCYLLETHYESSPCYEECKGHPVEGTDYPGTPTVVGGGVQPAG